jgi:Aspartyl/Asparaginyl beta-hydroxylase
MVLKSGLPWLELEIPIHAERAYLEATDLRDRFVKHRSITGWNSLCLHGISAAHTEHSASYGYLHERHAPHRWTDAADACPYLVALISKLWFAELYRARLMLLEPGASIPDHKDSSVHCLSSINIALNDPVDCHFFVEGFGRVPFAAGKAIMVDVANVHRVENRSREDRYHLIVQGILDVSNPKAQELLIKSFLSKVSPHSERKWPESVAR